MSKQTFKGKLVGMGPGKAWTCMVAPFKVEKVWGTKARIAIKGTLNGFKYQTSLFPMGKGKHVMMVNKAMQAGAKAKQGDAVKVVMEPDTATRKVVVPKDLKAAIAKSKKGRKFFDGLSYSHRKEYVRWITDAKKAETRKKRIKEAVAMLAAGKKRM